MESVLCTLSIICAAIGLVGSVVRRFPSLGASIVALLLLLPLSTPPFSVVELFILVALSVAATLSTRYVAPRITTRWGGTKSGYCGAVVGMVAGFTLYPPLGAVIAPLFGAVMGEMLVDRSDTERLFRVGFSSFCAFMLSAWSEFVIALWVVWLLVNSIFEAWWSDIEALIDNLHF